VIDPKAELLRWCQPQPGDVYAVNLNPDGAYVPLEAQFVLFLAYNDEADYYEYVPWDDEHRKPVRLYTTEWAATSLSNSVTTTTQSTFNINRWTFGMSGDVCRWMVVGQRWAWHAVYPDYDKYWEGVPKPRVLYGTVTATSNHMMTVQTRCG
jgi:hypothetical protein